MSASLNGSAEVLMAAGVDGSNMFWWAASDTAMLLFRGGQVAQPNSPVQVQLAPKLPLHSGAALLGAGTPCTPSFGTNMLLETVPLHHFSWCLLSSRYNVHTGAPTCILLLCAGAGRIAEAGGSDQNTAAGDEAVIPVHWST
jgi:hypothetical protein